MDKSKSESKDKDLEGKVTCKLENLSQSLSNTHTQSRSIRGGRRLNFSYAFLSLIHEI